MSCRTMRRVGITAGVLAAAALVVACDRGPAEDTYYEEDGVNGQREALGGVNYGAYDAEITPFLNDYYDDNEMFSDDDLTFDSRQGVVTINGRVDSADERDALVGWVDRVPGVREVDSTGLSVGE